MNQYDSYKESGVEWLGEVPEHWEIKKLKFLAQIQTGNTPSRTEENNFSKTNGMLWIKPEDLNQSCVIQTKEYLTKKGLRQAKYIPANSIFVCCIGSVGKMGYSNQPSTTNQQINSLIFNKLIEFDFARYMVMASEEEHIRNANGNVVIILNGETQKSIKFPLPPLSEQTAIAQYLDDKTAKIDRAIALEQQQIELLKERKQIVIQTAVTRGLNPDVAFKDSGVEWLGEVPEHWEIIPNKYIFKLKKQVVGKNSSQYDLLSLTLKGIIKRDMENPEGKFPAEFDTYQEVKEGDFVFCLFDVEETPRTVGLSSYNGMITGAYTIFETNHVNKQFIYYFYLNLDNGKKLKPLYKGLRNTISKENFFSFNTFIPPLSEQTAIAHYLDEQTAKIDHAISIKLAQIDKLKEYKTVLINEVVTGKRKVVV